MKYFLLDFSLLMLCSEAAFCFSDFAVEVTDFQGSFFAAGLYDDPAAVLGKPALRCRNRQVPGAPAAPDFRVKIVEAAYNLSLDGERVITEIYPDEWIAVRFDHKVLDFPGNPYGQDLIVFGNSCFEYDGSYVVDSTNMNTLKLAHPAGGYFEQILVSVSQDGLTWYSFDPNCMDPNSVRCGDGLYPTQAFGWDRAGACWIDREMDFTRPVDPNLKLADFAGLSAADVIDLYRGSGGGTPFDLRDLPDFEALQVDPQTGCRWIQYVRLEGGSGPDATGGEIDAVADVAACGDPMYPYPDSDLNQDCRVNLDDILLLSLQWLAEGTIEDLMRLSENWLQCTYRCEE